MDHNIDYSGKFCGKYKLLKKLGKGSFGSVYLALDTVLKVQKAIKIMDVSNPQQAIELFKEAELPYKCNHNNIIKILGGSIEAFESNACFVIEMEVAQNGSIESLLKKNQLSIVDSVDIIKGVLFALQHSHNLGIIHRDIKPANILLNNKTPKLSDFGLATTFNEVLPQNSLWYITHAAPEIGTTNTPSVQTDIYALGMTFYRMVNCIDDWYTYLNKIKNANTWLQKGTFVEKVGFAPYVPTKLTRIVRKACKPQTKDRYLSASEMRDDLEKLVPKINWIRINQDEWLGTSATQKHSAKIVIKRNAVHVEIKINNRSVGSDSKKYDTTNQDKNLSNAREYLNCYIAKTMFK